MYYGMLQNAVLKIESIKEYYFSQIDQLEENVWNDSKKYTLGATLNRYLSAKVMEKPSILEGETGSKIKEISEFYIEDLQFTKSEENKVTLSYKINNREKLEKQGIELNIQKAVKEYNKLQDKPVLFGNSALMMLIIKYEEAISHLFEYLISTYPSAYLNKRTMCFSEILEIDTDIVGIKDYFVKKEVEEIMRQNITEWYNLLAKNHKITLTFSEDYFKEFKEIYYRRNVIVHNNGVVNKAYIQGVDESARKNIIEGDKLLVNKAYLERAFELTYIMIYGTFLETIKLCKDKESLRSLIFDLGFQHMLKNEWDVSKYIFYNLERIKDQQASDIMMDKVNYWISIKNSKGIDEIKEEIEDCDVSAMSDTFKMAKTLLLDQHEKTSNLLEKVFPSDISAGAIEVWPLFIQYRESEEYKKFKEAHCDYFNVYDYEQELNQSEEPIEQNKRNDINCINELDDKSVNEEVAYSLE